MTFDPLHAKRPFASVAAMPSRKPSKKRRRPDTEGLSALIDALSARLQQEGDATRAAGQKAYLKSELAFFGVAQPVIRVIARELAREHPHVAPLELARALFETRWHEHRAVAIAVLELRASELGPSALPTLIGLVREGAGWAYVDWLATKVIGPILAANPRELRRLESWAGDDDFWVRRTALLAMNDALRAGGGDFELFSKLAVPMLGEREFFIRKAIGWVLREVSKKRPALVRAFVERHRHAMSGLTLREATKYLAAPAAESGRGQARGQVRESPSTPKSAGARPRGRRPRKR